MAITHPARAGFAQRANQHLTLYEDNVQFMKALFKELPLFSRFRSNYLDDDEYAGFQQFLLKQPEAGAVIQGTGGLRKIRWSDSSRGKGKRGGSRIIYYWYSGEAQFWLFLIYGKDVADDLTQDQKAALKAALETELKARGYDDGKA